MDKDTIENWLEIWAKTDALMPSPRHKPYRALWPDMYRSYYEEYGWTEAEEPRARPTPQQISIMDIVNYHWLPLFDKHQRLYTPRLIKEILRLRGLGLSFYEIEGVLFAKRKIPGMRAVKHDTCNTYHKDAVNFLKKNLVKIVKNDILDKHSGFLRSQCNSGLARGYPQRGFFIGET